MQSSSACLGWVAVAAACTSGASPRAGEQPEGWDEGVRVAEASDDDPAEDVVAVSLEARIAPVEIVPGVTTEVWTYDGQLPGPTIRARVGDRLVVTFTNSLPQATTIHWHGLRVDAAMDGTDMAQDPIQPGESFTYDMVLRDAGTYWYHPHVFSSAQIGSGLYGAIVVEDPEDPAFGDDLVLVLSDIGLDEEGRLLPGDYQGWFGDYFGRQGGIALVNGRELPRVRARVGVPQRWRIVNASRAKYARVGMPEHGFTQIATDGGLLEHAVPDAAVMLPPGARAEVVFEPRGGTGRTIDVVDTGVDHFHIEVPPPRVTLMHVDVADEPPARPPAIPDRLRTIPPLDLTEAIEQRLEFADVLAPDGNTYMGINGQLYEDSDPFMAHVDTTEIWTLVNHTGMDHPFHLHGFFFQVLDAGGALYDTFNIEPDVPVRIGIHFDDRPGMWMFHCHIIDHADAGMMRMLMVETSH
jgi:FtsP/CotA-like multicopper oxidase with cupredoxin domain